MWGDSIGWLLVDKGTDRLWWVEGDQGDGWRSGEFEVENPAQVHGRNAVCIKRPGQLISRNPFFCIWNLIT